MSFLSGQNVLLGVTGSIAAYKSAHIVRELIKVGANVKVGGDVELTQHA